ncbi:F-box associated domain type 3 [Arabidopsis thaliana x Arabidopsis arenosa]|uniref:F-box associated domain type 3 n=1 Tax=Arabidopsis thaliana x Arabidopsis arenosa TaxID=1240361 RepID=A0A8T2C2N8_9BRAS|nr:F-box associated domain type 3 [Arabidopsis thaliana x Arabidopsis arenosa]
MIMISDSIPTELILEILSRLPAKSIARFHCVSKQWSSMLSLPYFTELFLTRTSAQPRLLFAIEKKGSWSFFSLPQQYEKSSSSLVLAAEFHMKFPPDNMQINIRSNHWFPCVYASGLIFFYGMLIKEKGHYGVPVICNPITRRYAVLPYLQTYQMPYTFFGFDPIDKQFKVLLMDYPFGLDHHKILTLGTGDMSWRRIKCSLKHQIMSKGICINGVLYYLGETSANNPFIVCFDIRSEKFKFIHRESSCQLINYKGKLGVIYRDYFANDAIALRVWILEDVEKQEWSKYAYSSRDDKFLAHLDSIVGVTATGEIVLSMADYKFKQPFYVCYFNPERNTFQRVYIQGFGEYQRRNHSRVYVFANHVEDLNVNDSNLLKSSIYAPYVKTEEEEN